MSPLNRAVKNLSYLGNFIRDPVKSKSRLFRLVKWIWLAVSFFIIIPQATFIYIKRSDILKIMTAFTYCTTVIGTTIKLIILMILESDIRRLVNEIISSKIRGAYAISHQMKIEQNYWKIDARLDRISQIFQYLLICGLICYTLKPAGLQYYAYLMDTVTNDTYLYPFEDIYIFDTSVSPIYEIIYVIASLSVSVGVFSALSTDQLYLGLSMYVIGLLELMLADLDEDGNYEVEIRIKRIIECIQFHKDIICFIKRIDALFSKIIFDQFCSSLAALIGIICESILVSNIQPVITLLVGMCMMTELLLFCWTGALVADESYNLSKSVYSLSWYNYSTTEKKLLYLIILRTQTECGFLALGYFSCNTQSFTKIASHAFSVLALIRKIA